MYLVVYILRLCPFSFLWSSLYKGKALLVGDTAPTIFLKNSLVKYKVDCLVSFSSILMEILRAHETPKAYIC